MVKKQFLLPETRKRFKKEKLLDSDLFDLRPSSFIAAMLFCLIAGLLLTFLADCRCNIVNCRTLKREPQYKNITRDHHRHSSHDITARQFCGSDHCPIIPASDWLVTPNTGLWLVDRDLVSRELFTMAMVTPETSTIAWAWHIGDHCHSPGSNHHLEIGHQKRFFYTKHFIFIASLQPSIQRALLIFVPKRTNKARFFLLNCTKAHKTIKTWKLFLTENLPNNLLFSCPPACPPQRRSVRSEHSFGEKLERLETTKYVGSSSRGN